MDEKPLVNIFWFRRDLRLQDNAGLYHALSSRLPVLPLFIYDKNILSQLPDRDDARVTFIHRTLNQLNENLKTVHSSLLIKHNPPVQAFHQLLTEFNVQEVFANEDYEPYARIRDSEVESILQEQNIPFKRFKDHVIFEKNEVAKDSGQPYTVYTPYKKRWMDLLQPSLHFKPYPNSKHFQNFYRHHYGNSFSLADLGFTESKIPLPEKSYRPVLANYANTRDYPAIEGTSKIGIHLRFGTISVRELAAGANLHSSVWLSELIWREFYSMILWNFPESATRSFKKEYENIRWRNNEEEFAAWCEGRTGYPIVDAGMRQLNQTGWMHNRVRMIVASFLCKHLLIDWRWGEAYFARKLLDYDMASNVGGWQWAAGTGNDAAPYFRIFNPDLQTKKFDPELVYIKKWVPEFADPFKYPSPIVDHRFARQRALETYKAGLQDLRF
ncbi:cryptochrome/photolyase family protein [Paradesertivirga mongoliensis]|uniref:Cryptochrome/photolyase family protein n=1 Tax=Paradesertivirga mongoliensis TaxID=2100740 RepID=A0ABW4ZJY7_9SPHI|nr:deoxyribodipyrimidine photo-lyase [Pedobacter mongoliensis]